MKTKQKIQKTKKTTQKNSKKLSSIKEIFDFLDKNFTRLPDSYDV